MESETIRDDGEIGELAPTALASSRVS